MKLRQRDLISVALLIAIALMLMPSMHASATGIAPSLGAASTFAILGASKVTNNGPTTVTGNLGIYPNGASDVTGFIFSALPGAGTVTGTVHIADLTAQTAQADALYAFVNLMSQTCDVDYGLTQDLSGLILGPGVYCAGQFTLGAALPLKLDAGGDPNAVWIFKTTQSLLTTSSGSQVTVINDPSNTSHCRVFWPVTGPSAVISHVTLASSSLFLGTIIVDGGDIVIENGAYLHGRAIALRSVGGVSYGTVSMDTSTVDADLAKCTLCPSCPPGTTVMVTTTEVRTMTETATVTETHGTVTQTATVTVIQPVGTTVTVGTATVTQTQCTECPVTQTVTVTQTSPPTSSITTTLTITQTQTTTTTQQPGGLGLNFPFAIGIGAGVAALGVGVAVAASRPLEGWYYCRKHKSPVWSFSGWFWCPVDSTYLSRIEVAFYPLRHFRSPLGWLRRLLW